MELTSSHRNALDRLWQAFNERNVPYVVLRGYEGLPESFMGSDIDVLTAEESFDTAVSQSKRVFHPSESISRNALDLVSLVVRNPNGALTDILQSPRNAVYTANRRLFSSDVSSRGYVERQFEASDLKLHLVNHLAYVSPMDGSRIRVDPVVEEDLFGHRVEHGAFFVPAPPDRLAHLICRGVFDYDGDFPARYTSRCETLLDGLQSDPGDLERFRELLSHLFYQADTLVYNLVTAGEYDSIYSELIRYADY